MKLFLRTISLASTLAAALMLHGQLSHGGLAFGLMENGPRLDQPPVVRLPNVDAAPLIEEDLAREAVPGTSVPFRFGFEHPVDIGMDRGIWTELESGDRIWRVVLECPEALSIGVLFSEYVVPEGALVFLYNEAGTQHGAFMAAPGGRTTMAIDQVAGERVTLEYFEPARHAGTGSLRIGRVTHAYRDALRLIRDFGDSDTCNINAICPVGDGLRDQIRSVALINTGSSYCTGTLLNNCAEDATPYVITSNQCLSSSTNNWVFRFNWDSPECSPSELAEFPNSISGATLLVNDAATDVALVEINEIPPPYYQVFFSGWDTTGAVPSSVAAIHHPVADVKKLSRSSSAIQSIDTLPFWSLPGWDEGNMQSGSTGCGLWDQNGLLIGNYIQGYSDCDTNIFDIFSRFDQSYPLLKPFLGDCAAQMPGIDWVPIIPIVVDASVTSITEVPPVVCATNTITPKITLKNNGDPVITSVIINYGVAGGVSATAGWSGSLLPGQTANYTLPGLVVPPGDHVLQAASNSPNGEDDDWPFNNSWFLPFTMNSPSAMVNLHLTTDDFGTETTWELSNENGTVLYSGGPYQNIASGEQFNIPLCLTNGCYTFTIYDTFGDGICCEEGNGNYLIQQVDGPVLAISNGEFTFENTNIFCLDQVSVEEQAIAGEVRVFPNPTNGLITVRIEGVEDASQLTFTDGVGRTVATRSISANEPLINLDLGGLANGVYMLTVETAQGRIVTRVMVQH